MFTQPNKRYLFVLITLLILCIFIVLIVGNGKKNRSEKFQTEKNRVLLVSFLPLDSVELPKNVKTIEFAENVSIDSWNKLVKILSQSYSDFDAFIILHEPETIKYTACALSFLLENLEKSVILTCKNSLFSSIKTATNIKIPEVLICKLENKDVFLLRSNGFLLAKNDTMNGDMILDFPTEPFNPMFLNTKKQILIIKLYPGINLYNLVQLAHRKIDGIILDGKIPLEEKLIKAVHTLMKKGIIVVNLCETEGIGIVVNNTVETAFAKLHFFLSNLTKYNQEMIQKMFELSLRGE